MTDTTATTTTRSRKGHKTDLAAELASANTASAAVWATTKGLAVGDQVAPAIKGRPANGPQPFRTITAIDRPTASSIVLSLGDDKAMAFGPATKLFVIKASTEESPEAREARHQAKAVRDADHAAKVAEEKGSALLPGSPEAKAQRHAKSVGKALLAAVVAAPAPAPAAKASTPTAAQRDTEAFRGKEAPTGYIVRWTAPQIAPATDYLKASDKATEPGWLVRCNAHGTTSSAKNVEDCKKVGTKAQRLTWCEACAK